MFLSSPSLQYFENEMKVLFFFWVVGWVVVVVVLGTKHARQVLY
jgi:hypothetical protein